MYELIQVTKNTYYIDSPTKVGVYQIDDHTVYLIDSGSDHSAGKKILKSLDEMGWQVKAIINTHSHADHIGGNHVIQSKTGCPIYAYGRERLIIAYPDLEPCYLYGGYPGDALRNKFLMAQASTVSDIEEAVLPAGFLYFPLPGHAHDMIGITTPDGVCFLADSLARAEILDKYHILYLYDLKAHLQTLEHLLRLRAVTYIPSHTPVLSDVTELVSCNQSKIKEVIGMILKICVCPQTEESIIQQLFRHYHLPINFVQHVLIGSTIRSYLSYLQMEGSLEAEFIDYQLNWRVSKEYR